MPYPVRIAVFPSLNGSHARPTRGAKSFFGASTTNLPNGDCSGKQFGNGTEFCVLIIIPLQKSLPAAATRLPAPVTSGASAGFQDSAIKFERRPFLSQGAPKKE